MRCRRVRHAVLEGAGVWPAAIEEHLNTCAKCAAYAQDWVRLRKGLAQIAGEPAPEPSLGFATRLVRSLQEAAADARAREASLERTGRRFV
ncbi:MAG TPA: hypothetical protein VL523_00900, partial [Terriglobia bacterium]|nr:hypothetical protein [Terriglobia bacterium]